MLDPQKLKEDMVLVYKTWDETAAAVARSILEESDIACMVKGGLAGDVTGISRLGTMFSSGAEPVEVYVLQSDVDGALRHSGPVFLRDPIDPLKIYKPAALTIAAAPSLS